ncbi:MAG: hypothetical protein O3A63_21370 [Proteobacteria bacterium]|nr:hypothetical protein [Pseudomonadota bacterium]
MKMKRLLVCSFLFGLLIAAIVNAVGIMLTMWLPAHAWMVFVAIICATMLCMPLYERLRVVELR